MANEREPTTAQPVPQAPAQPTPQGPVQPVPRGPVPRGPVPPAPASRGKDTVSSATIVVIGAAVVIGFFMVICTGGASGPGQSGIGIGLLVLGVPIVVAAGYALTHRPPQGRGAAGAATAAFLLLIMGGALAAVLASVAGQLVRWVDPADYTGRYGTQVTATLPVACENDVKVYASGAKAADADIVCRGATWQVDGQMHTGTVIINFADVDLPTGVSIPETVEAYVLGDKGYSVQRVGEVENVAIWGSVPLWWLLPAVPVAALSLLALRVAGWTAERAPDGESKLARRQLARALHPGAR